MKQYLEILRYCLNDSIPMPERVKSTDWQGLLLWAQKQAIIGIVFSGIKKLNGEELEISHDILYQWIAYSQQIEGQNRLANQRCTELIEKLAKDGFDSCILKGQGNATYYPDPYTRTPGDIDVWVKSKSNARCKKDDIRRVIEYIRKRNPSAVACNIHVEYGDFGGVEVEIHYRPAIFI